MTDFTIHRAHLLPAIEAAVAATPTRSTIPILGNLLLEADGDRLHVTGSDLDIEVAASAPLENCAAAGAFTVPGRLLFDMARQFPESGEVAFRVDGTDARIACGRSRYRLQMLPATDFPSLARDGLTHRFSLPGRTLVEAFGQVSHAISREASRYYLGGVFLHQAEAGQPAAGLCFVALDGHRLAATGMAAPDGSAGAPGIIVPARAVAMIGKLAARAEEMAIALGETRIAAEASIGDGTVAVVSKLVDGTFPDWRRVVPGGGGTLAAVGREALARAVARVMLIGSARGLALDFGEALTISAANADAGEADETIDYERRAGAPMRIGANGRYLGETLAAMAPAAEITVAMSAPGDPVLLRAPGVDAVHVIMPMRV